MASNEAILYKSAGIRQGGDILYEEEKGQK